MARFANQALIIPLTQGKIAIVDEEDWLKCIQYRWHAAFVHGIYYARTYIQCKQCYLHNFIMGKDEIDHVNRDGLDNRRNNLRVATHAQNCVNRNTSKPYGFRGVHLRDKKYQASLRTNGKFVYLGRYTTPVEAAKAYDEAAIKHHGKFAVLNFPLEV